VILEKEFNWYFKIVQKTFFLVGGWIIFTGLIGRFPFLGWLFGLFVLPITWLLKVGGAGYVGYKTVKKYQGTSLQALVSGGIFGGGIGLASMAASLLKMMLGLNFAKMFLGTFALVMVIFSEAISGLIFGLIGGILAGSPAKPAEEKKKK
jgi:hypothetical protein